MGTQCRLSECRMNFKSSSQRDYHEKLMHKNMYNSAAKRIFQTILKSNIEDTLIRKSIKIGIKYFSYREIEKAGFESEEYLFLERIFSDMVKDYLKQNENKLIEDFFRESLFIIG